MIAMPPALLRAALLLGYTLLSVAGMALIKAAPALLSPRWLAGFALYVAGFIVWIGVILRLMPLSQAFPIAAGALMLGTQLAGWLVLKERLTPAHLAGAALIAVGVAVVSLAAQPEA